MLTIIKGKDPIWDTDDFDVVLVGTSIGNNLSGGFSSKVGFKYPMADEVNKLTKIWDINKLGTRQTIGKNPTVSLLYIADVVTGSGKLKIDYDALEKCLLTANAEFRGKRAITTILGSSPFDGNGDKYKCLNMMEKCLTDLEVDVYDYEQKTRDEEIAMHKKYLRSLRYTDMLKYDKLINAYDDYLKKLYLNG